MEQPSVTQWNNEGYAVEGADWEEQSYLEGCAHVREQARRKLKTLDDELLECKPRGLRVEGVPRADTGDSVRGGCGQAQAVQRWVWERDIRTRRLPGMEASSAGESVADREHCVDGQ